MAKADSKKATPAKKPALPTKKATRRPSGLGRGLSALLQDEAAADIAPVRSRRGNREVPIESLHANSFQPRTIFDEQALKELADSISEHGIMQPILVRPSPEDPDSYEIIAGERRWRAAQKARLHQVPVVIRSLSDLEALELALIENIQREDLSPVDEAKGFRRLMDDFGHRQEDIAKTVGKSRPYVANLLRLLTLPAAVQDMLNEGQLSVGHARALITTDDPIGLAKTIVAQGLSVRAAESLAQDHSSARKTKPQKGAARKDADTRALEARVSQQIGLAVSIDHKGPKGGKVVVKYKTLEQLDSLLETLSH
jgi:ParB family transcriptional regulator, chromosome partitioning protein